MFLTSRRDFEDYLDSAKRPFMADFYKRQRRASNILIDRRRYEPRGGKWSFDEANRKSCRARSPRRICRIAWTDHGIPGT